MEGIFIAFREGGVFMYAILGIAGVAITMAFFRIRKLFFGHVNAEKLLVDFEKSVLTGNVENLIKECDGSPNSSTCKVVKAAAQRIGRDEEHIGYAIRAVVNEENPKLTKGLAELPLLANVSTLFGLLGTITGLILSFKAMGGLDPAARQQLLAKGISEAMNCTAFGLLVAVGILLLNAVLYQRSTKLVNETNTLAQRLMEIITSRVYRRKESKQLNETTNVRGVA